MSTPETPSPSDPRERLKLVVAMGFIMVGNFVQMLDMTIANVALPHMQGGLQADRDEINWVVTSYIISAAIMTPPVGWLASRFGKRNLYVVCMAGFTITSAMCGAAQTLDEMVLFRLLQGGFGAAISPLAQAIVFDRFPVEQRARVLSWWAMLILMAPIVGPTLGGWLTDSYSWRSVFYINVPLGIMITLGVALFLKRRPLPARANFDLTGFLIFSAAVIGFQLMLDRGQTNDWFSSNEILIEFVVACVAAYLFVVHVKTSDARLFPPAMFRDRSFIMGMVLMSIAGGIMIVTSVLLPQFLQTLGGYTVFHAGVLQAPRGLGAFFSTLLVGRLLSNPRADPRQIVFIGGSGIVVTLWMMANWTPDVSAATVAVVSLFQGLALGFVFVPTNLIAFSTLSAPLRTDGAAFMSLVRSVIAAVVVSIATTVIARYSQIMHAYLAEAASPFNRELWMNGPGLFWNPYLPLNAEALESVISRNAVVVAYSNAFKLLLYLSCLLPIATVAMGKVSYGPKTKAVEVLE